MKIAFISTNQDGNYYIGYKVSVPRGIKGKKGSKAEELLIIGLHKSHIKQWLKDHIDEMEFE